jgi:hypothetical protein
MAQAQSYDTPSTTPADHTDGTESAAPSTAAYTDSPVSRPKDGEGHWGTSARWFLLALLAVAFFFALTVLRH